MPILKVKDNGEWKEIGEGSLVDSTLTVAGASADAKVTGDRIDELNSHVSNTSNPHNVTKAQLGLGNVDNTADANKSVNYANSANYAAEANYATYAENAGHANSSGSASTATTAGNVTGIVGVGNGGTDATDAAGARRNLGITPDNIGATKKFTITSHGDHLKYVIALCYVSPSDSTSTGSYSIGTITFHRDNGLEGPGEVQVGFEDAYFGANSANVFILSGYTLDQVQPVVFTHNGVGYAGLSVYISAPQMQRIEFNGTTNFTPFSVPYYNVYTGEIVHQEINASVTTNGIKYTHGNRHLNGTNFLLASASCNRNWQWAAQSGTPAYVWGTNNNSGTDCYVWNPANFSVNYANGAGYATSAGSADYANGAGYASSAGSADYANSAGSASTASTAGSAKSLVLNSSNYGSTLPSSGTTGQVFFKI